MPLIYKQETIASPDGTLCKVLDTDRIDFNAAFEGRKATETLVRCAVGGERIETKNAEKKVEALYIAKAGDAIFINLHNPDDVYVPGNPDGSRWRFKDLAHKGYEMTGEDHKRGGILVKSTATAKLLHEIIQQPTCIKNAWGEGQHQFLFAGATLKQDDKGHVTGIDKEAFDATWEIKPKPSQPVPATNAPPKSPPK